MSVLSEKWRLHYDGCPLELSARRLWEHVELGQINPFPFITPPSAGEPQSYVDIVDGSGPVQTLTGLTLADLLAGNCADVPEVSVRELLVNVERAPARRWLTGVGDLGSSTSSQEI